FSPKKKKQAKIIARDDDEATPPYSGVTSSSSSSSSSSNSSSCSFGLEPLDLDSSVSFASFKDMATSSSLDATSPSASSPAVDPSVNCSASSSSPSGRPARPLPKVKTPSKRRADRRAKQKLDPQDDSSGSHDDMGSDVEEVQGDPKQLLLLQQVWEKKEQEKIATAEQKEHRIQKRLAREEKYLATVPKKPSEIEYFVEDTKHSAPIEQPKAPKQVKIKTETYKKPPKSEKSTKKAVKTACSPEEEALTNIAKSREKVRETCKSKVKDLNKNYSIITGHIQQILHFNKNFPELKEYRDNKLRILGEQYRLHIKKLNEIAAGTISSQNILASKTHKIFSFAGTSEPNLYQVLQAAGDDKGAIQATLTVDEHLNQLQKELLEQLPQTYIDLSTLAEEETYPFTTKILIHNDTDQPFDANITCPSSHESSFNTLKPHLAKTFSIKTSHKEPGPLTVELSLTPVVKGSSQEVVIEQVSKFVIADPTTGNPFNISDLLREHPLTEISKE
ncbi:MAG: hypothetical protein RLZ12_412, partial [Bacillota bacterium]